MILCFVAFFADHGGANIARVLQRYGYTCSFSWAIVSCLADRTRICTDLHALRTGLADLALT